MTPAMTAAPQMGQQTRLKQEQKLAPQQLQGLGILELSRQELEQRISTELETNPVLELNPEPAEKEEDRELEPEDGGNPLDSNREDLSEYVDDMVSQSDGDLFAGEADDYGDGGEHLLNALNRGGDPAGDERDPFAAVSEGESLQDMLLEQLRFSDCPQRLRHIAETVISGIAANGYYEMTAEETAQLCGCTEDEAEEAIRLVRSFDPPGIAAFDLKECLLLQIRRNPENFSPRLPELIEKHLDDLPENRLPKIAKEMSISAEELRELLGELKKLDPAPGSAFSHEHAGYIYPEAVVKQDEDGEYRLDPEYDPAPKIGISSFYSAMAEDPATPEDAKKYLQEKINSARQLQNGIQLREKTISRIAQLLVSSQQEYLGGGELKPLAMKDIADKIGHDESTVSRAVKDKYMQTPRGLIPFRAFFSNGDDIVKSQIREIVEDEDKSKPLSDDAIAKILEERGTQAARRTIAKYRDQLGIPSSARRKEL